MVLIFIFFKSPDPDFYDYNPRHYLVNTLRSSRPKGWEHNLLEAKKRLRRICEIIDDVVNEEGVIERGCPPAVGITAELRSMC